MRAFCEVWSMQSKGLEIGEKLWRSDEKYTQTVLGWFLLLNKRKTNGQCGKKSRSSRSNPFRNLF